MGRCTAAARNWNKNTPRSNRSALNGHGVAAEVVAATVKKFQAAEELLWMRRSVR